MSQAFRLKLIIPSWLNGRSIWSEIVDDGRDSILKTSIRDGRAAAWAAGMQNAPLAAAA
jgi:hypothetical protein